MDHQRLGDRQHRRAIGATDSGSSIWSVILHFARRSVLTPITVIKGDTMPKMTKAQLIDAISDFEFGVKE